MDTPPTPPARPPRRLRPALRVLLACAMVGVGIGHFVAPTPFVRIVPAWLPAPLLLVYASGLFEVLGGVGLLIPRVRRAAGIGLAALYLAVFPANVNMAVNQATIEGAARIPAALLWARLPFQAVFIAWALWVSKKDEER
ncbi:MAG: DoxX family membrane protein [Minicystis sp.]